MRALMIWQMAHVNERAEKKTGKVYNDGVLDTLFNGSTNETIDI